MEFQFNRRKKNCIGEVVSKKATHIFSLIQAHMVRDGDLQLLRL